MKINYFEISRIPTVDAKKVLATIEDDERNPNRKRRRLDNLNVEERILRRYETKQCSFSITFLYNINAKFRCFFLFSICT